MAKIDRVIITLVDKSVYIMTNIKSFFADSEGGVQITGIDTKGESDRFPIDTFSKIEIITDSKEAELQQKVFVNESQELG